MDQYRDSLIDAVNPPHSATPVLLSPTNGIRTYSADHSIYQSNSQYLNAMANGTTNNQSINQSDSQSSLSLTSNDDSDNDSLYEEDLDTDDRRILCNFLSLRLYNILVLSLGLMFLFAAFNTLQSWITNLLPVLGFPDLGNWSLGVLYVSVCVALFGTPPLVARLGHIRAIIVGSVCYLVYIASLIHIWPAVVLVTSSVIGFGASLLWVAIGGFLTRCSAAKDRGLYTGIFWSIFQLSGIIGNVAAYYIFNQTQEPDGNKLFIIFTCLATFGTLMLFALKKFPSDIQAEKEIENERAARLANQSNNQSDDQSVDESLERPTTMSLLKSMWHISTSSTLLFLSPSFLFQGIEFSFWNGEFPQLFDARLLGVIMVFAGVGEAVGGLTMGALSDRIGRSLTWMMGSILFSIAVACMYAIKQGLSVATGATIFIHIHDDVEFNVPVIAFIAAFCFGLADSAINTQIYAILGNKYKKQDNQTINQSLHLSKSEARKVRQDDDQRVVAAFTYFNFQQNIGAAIGFIIQPLIPVHGSDGTNNQLYLNLWLMVIASIGFTACDRGWVEWLVQTKPETSNDRLTDRLIDEKGETDSSEWAESDHQETLSTDEGTATPILSRRQRPVSVL